MDIKEHGMLYKSEMVNAILREIDPKLQTRRPITFANSLTGGAVNRKEWHLLDWDNAEPWTVGIPVLLDGYSDYCTMRLPAWRVPFKGDLVTTVYPRIWPGHRIWAREKWRIEAWQEEENIKVEYAADNLGSQWLNCTDADMFTRLRGQSEVDAINAGAELEDGRYIWYSGGSPCRWRSSMLMPRWASRINLNVTGMRSQRIQEISAMDAIAEGIERSQASTVQARAANEVATFHALWDSINTERGFPWAGNHPVWIHDFKRIKKEGADGMDKR